MTASRTRTSAQRNQISPSSIEPMGPTAIGVRRRLLRWANSNGRTFAWRSWRDPYRLAVTEVLLKQTRAEAVALVIPPLFRQFPTAEAIAAAGPELEAMIRGLGFGKQRAKQLRALGVALAERIPKPKAAAAEWQQLPGIGAYSAGMVAAVLGDGSAVAVDTNIARVVCRLFGLVPSRTEARKRPDVWLITSQLVAGAQSSAKVHWALLDLAAAICVARNPRCSKCPLRTTCVVGLRSVDKRIG
jgi:A/G-specific adenine glycosylase